MPLNLDHLVIAVRDLSIAEENYTRLLGRKPSWRGKHPTYGTANVLYRLDNSYMELLALGDGDSPWATALRNHLDRHGEGLYAIALGTDDIDATVAAARANGLDVQDAAAGDGVDETTGARREWRNARIGPASTRGVRAFFIQHLSPPDALPMSEPVATGGAIVTGVDHTVIISSDLAATLALWTSAIGLELRRTVDFSSARRLHFLRLGHSILELAGPPQAGESRERDLLWGVSYRVDNAAAQVERLRAAGLDVSDARTGRADATVVADLKPGFSHEVRTLFIEK
ncbi:MAG: VOC family protein [Dehalococcoidia bacterium]